MNYLSQELGSIGILLIFSIFLSVVIVLFSYLVGSSNPDVEKVSVYECGFDPYEDARNIFNIKFYLVSILFIVFDLEAIYFFPWSSSCSFLSVEGFWSLIEFALELIIGYIYAWKIGALEWE